MIDLEKKVALITGSSRGIGRGCAIELAKCGADVIINYYRHGDEAEEVAEIVRGLGRSAIVIGADVSDVNAVEEMINEALDYYGQIDILVSNAAMSVRKPFLETTVEEVSKTLDVCMWGVFYVTDSGQTDGKTRSGWENCGDQFYPCTASLPECSCL